MSADKDALQASVAAWLAGVGGIGALSDEELDLLMAALRVTRAARATPVGCVSLPVEPTELHWKTYKTAIGKGIRRAIKEGRAAEFRVSARGYSLTERQKFALRYAALIELGKE